MLEVLIPIFIVGFAIIVGFVLGGVFSAASHFSPRYPLTDEIKSQFPVLKDGYRWTVLKASPFSRVYIEQKTWYGWKFLFWSPFTGGVGNIAAVTRNPDDWWRQDIGLLATSVGKLANDHPHLLKDSNG